MLRVPTSLVALIIGRHLYGLISTFEVVQLEDELS
jgi:hypothetical protein